MDLYFTAWTTLAVLAVYQWTCSSVGFARIKYKVVAPSMDGPPEFMRRVRVQMNTLEQLPMLVVPLWLCAWFLGDTWAAAGGVLWCVGRVVYALAYYRNPAKRAPGFIISTVASVLLMAGTVVGLLTH
jgi:glutathione S-transferase